VSTLPASYLDAHRYDGAAIQHDRRKQRTRCTIQPRDLALLADVHRHKFLTAPQLLELWWPGRSAWAGQRRLLRLFRAGHLERFRPIARRARSPGPTTSENTATACSNRPGCSTRGCATAAGRSTTPLACHMAAHKIAQRLTRRRRSGR
jgi:hypothetical protein